MHTKEFSSSATIPALLRVGGPAEVATQKPTRSSEEFMTYWTNRIQSSRQSTSVPSPTPQTDRPEVSSPLHTSSFPQLKSPSTSNPSSSTSTPLPTPARTLLLNASLPSQKRTFPPPSSPDDNGRTRTSGIHNPTSNKFARLVKAIMVSTPDGQDVPTLYDESHLPALKTSPLRPHCDANERLRIWKPENPRNALDEAGNPTNLREEDLLRISSVLEEAYAPSTRGTYSTGLFAFHLFCDLKNIEEHHRAPANPTVLVSFIAVLAGTYAGSTIKNFIYGVRTWHIIHGSTWNVDANQLQALLTAGRRLTPAEAKKEEKAPWSVEYLEKICQGLKPTSSKDIAILACLTTAFWGTARLGEVTVPDTKSFKPSIHVKPSDVRHDIPDQNGLKQTEFNLPWTKAAMEKGEKIYWAQQDGISNPRAALISHLRINKPPANGHLFAYKFGKGFKPLTRDAFLKRVHQVAKANNLPPMPGHGIRVGSTLEYLLRGIPFEVVKAKGRWKSDAFRLYLRKHAQIMAPYMQANPNAFGDLVRHAMPPVR